MSHPGWGGNDCCSLICRRLGCIAPLPVRQAQQARSNSPGAQQPEPGCKPICSMGGRLRWPRGTQRATILAGRAQDAQAKAAGLAAWELSATAGRCKQTGTRHQLGLREGIREGIGKAANPAGGALAAGPAGRRKNAKSLGAIGALAGLSAPLAKGCNKRLETAHWMPCRAGLSRGLEEPGKPAFFSMKVPFTRHCLRGPHPARF